MTGPSRALLAATFAPGEEAIPAARRFTHEVMTAWATGAAALADADSLVSALAKEAAEAPFEVIWNHHGDAVRLELRQKDVPSIGLGAAPQVPVEEWGVTFSGQTRVRWATLPLPGMAGQIAAEWSEESAHEPPWLGFLADASDLLAGTLDPDMVPAIIAQIVVPRLSTWCAVYTSAGKTTRYSHPVYLWHADESRLDALRDELSGFELPVEAAQMVTSAQVGDLQMLVVPLIARGRTLGMMCLGRAERFPDDVVHVAQDIGRRAALSMDNARLYDQQAAANRALQRSLLPPADPDVPLVDYGVVYEPAGETNEVGGDFYDLFAGVGESWRFAIGDVCGTGPEAAAVTGLARHTLRLLAREGYGVAAVLGRLNQAILEEGERARFLTLLHGEISPSSGGLDVKLVSAGHPEALCLRSGGEVEAVTTPQSLLGVFPEAAFEADVIRLDPGDLLLAVTDGVTERRRGGRLLDDDGGLAKLLAECVGLSAQAVAERVRRAVQEFAPEPATDDLAILVLRAR
ncbi:Serine phosphatase RsbU, regulator of sigma subunit [Sinosporangium album]|uniref:Serine phosphatase RsbU, regulator of sigma subunit n=1 Tax=Sinosporangium album TaxID=504805 RepID=A0A1G7TYP9_9ACTN|nr:GAF domain-containing SpoIIE family protein phosphatase [Sinosporangium album]SDG40376.1 Serine phosphatase RsbU, regulator of sigma subunit [Sinosporangium album]